MNRRILTAAFMASLIVAGCAKDMDAGIYDDENRYLTAWLKQDHKDIGVDIRVASSIEHRKETHIAPRRKNSNRPITAAKIVILCQSFFIRI